MRNHLRILGIVCLLAVVSFSSQAQNTETRTPGSFNSLSIGIGAQVELTEGSSESIKIEARQLDKLETIVSDGKLRIRWKKGFRNWKARRNVKLWITYRALSKISVGGSASVIAKSVLKGNKFSLAVSGSGSITGQVAVSNLKTRISGSGSLRISGTTGSQFIGISGSGSMRAYDLNSTSAEVRISGSGSARISVKDAITARISGSGNVRYKGNPSKVISKSSGSGSVRSAN